MPERNELPYISVTSLNTLIKYKLEGETDLRGLYVKGEISNWKIYRSGVFFDLKDENGSVVSCLLWGNYASRLSFIPKDGDEVIAFGNITVYAARGRYSLQVFTLELFGLGASLLALENLKKKLAKEGLFDQARKRKIPSMPNTIGIIVGKNSAAESDLRKNILRRWPLTKIFFFYAQVQGLDAPKSIIKALNEAEECEIDTLIIARGGGSSEDLSAFNDETLVREFAKCPFPFISAVGHEIDFTLLDYVADLRVSTPTAAAEAATPNQIDIRNDLLNKEEELQESLLNKIRNSKEKLMFLARRQFFLNPASIYERSKEEVQNKQDRLSRAITLCLSSLSDKVKSYESRLKSSNPDNIVKRGYSITMGEDGIPITSAKNVHKGQKIKTKLKDGIIESEVLGEK